MTAAGRSGRRGGLTRQADELRLCIKVRAGDRGQQGARIGVPRRTQDFVDRPLLDDPAQIHHRHRMRQMVDNRKVVGNEQLGQPKVGLQAGQ